MQELNYQAPSKKGTLMECEKFRQAAYTPAGKGEGKNERIHEKSLIAKGISTVINLKICRVKRFQLFLTFKHRFLGHV